MTTIESKTRRTLLQPFLYFSLKRLNQVKDNGFSLETWDHSCKSVCQIYPNRIQKLFASLDLEQEAFKSIKVAVERHQWELACERLLHFYREEKAIPWLGKVPLKTPHTSSTPAEQILQDTFTFQRATDRVPRQENGRLDWSCKGSKGDREWAWFLNRHYHLIELLKTYQKTQEAVYARCISNHIIDWITFSPTPKNPSVWAQWRGLEAAYRMFHWTPVFFELQQVEAFTDAARILMLCSILDHAHYLRWFHDWGDNWVCREMIGLAVIALHWTEFKQSSQWLAYAKKNMVWAIRDQVYPDGVHKELTSHYHRIALRDFQNFANLLSSAGETIPAEFCLSLESMVEYLAYSMRPDGYSVLNNDSDQDKNQSLILKAATTYERPDWTYVASNGKAGEEPAGQASKVFPWAGQMVMRSGWDQAAHWAFFDVGPLGVNYHIHQDKLHLAVAAQGRDLLVDSGRYSYVRDEFWQYFRDSASHNVVLIDGKGQQGDIRQWQQPMRDNYAIEPDFDFAMGTCDRGFTHLPGKASHSRAVIYLRGHYWVVIDHIATDCPRKIQPLWHFHPHCTVAIEQDSVVSVDPEVGNLRIVPAAPFAWDVSLVSGQKTPIQGWWSREYNHLEPNPTAIYSAQIATSTTFAWVLYPAKGVVPQVQVNLLPSDIHVARVQVVAPDQNPTDITVRLHGEAAVPLGNYLWLTGKCAILRADQPPLVVHGTITHSNGNLVVAHPSRCNVTPVQEVKV